MKVMREIAMRGRDHRQELHMGGLCVVRCSTRHTPPEWGSLVRVPPLENAPRAVDMSAGGGLEPLPSSEEKEEEDGSMMLI